ncbi:FUSC family protein [Pseudomonas sp. MDT1-85]
MLIFGREGEVDVNDLVRAILVLTPVLALISEDSRWLLATVATISAYIGRERSGLAPIGVLLHGAAIAAGFVILVASLAVPVVFVMCTAALASLSILLTAKGAKLRSLGNFTFIPALYLTFEVSDRAPNSGLMAYAVHFLPFIIAAVLPVILLAVIEHIGVKPVDGSVIAHFGKIFSRKEFGHPVSGGEAMLTVAIAVAIAAAVVEWLQLPYGQWVIWSAASVVTGNVNSGNKKLYNRILGAIIGAPLGICLSFVIPSSAITVPLITVIGLLTLVGFRRYVVAMSIRCACAALGVALITHSDPLAALRAINIITGGLLGGAAAWGVHVFTLRRRIDKRGV